MSTVPDSRSRRSLPFPGRSRAVPGSTGEPFPRLLKTGNGTTAALPFWLRDLKTRGVTINITIRGPELVGAHSRNDLTQLQRHRHSLTVAAAGTHPHWWRHVTGHDPFPPTADEVPEQCATCGANPDWLDADLLAWCEAHVDPQLVADAATWRAAA